MILKLNIWTKYFLAGSALFLIIAFLTELGSRVTLLKSIFLRLGKLPGDIVIQKENMQVYFPWVTCLLLSVGLSLGCQLIQYFFNKK